MGPRLRDGSGYTGGVLGVEIIVSPVRIPTWSHANYI